MNILIPALKHQNIPQKMFPVMAARNMLSPPFSDISHMKKTLFTD
tara:strand:+ start:369 stop:503 length:135 start_codon:yes stop_codon:yes gene_type:complete